MVMPVGRMVQLAVTLGLVQMMVLLPAFPETAKTPVQAAPLVVVELKVNVPEKLVAVVVPVTVPFAFRTPFMAQTPETELSACVRVISNGTTVEPPACVD
jgi:hypothetical protein